MLKEKHTQGPWEVMISGKHVFVNSDDECVCITHNNDSLPPEKAIANARLIAAAPELLEACKDMVELLSRFINETSGDNRGTIVFLKVIRDAIAKAEGDK